MVWGNANIRNVWNGLNACRHATYMQVLINHYLKFVPFCSSWDALSDEIFVWQNPVSG